MIKYELLNNGEIYKIKYLWEQLNKIHFEDSIYFKDTFREMTFEKRIKNLLQYSSENIRIEIISTDNDRLVGYCIATIDENGKGEIESIFLEPDFRGRKLGETLIKHSLDWFKSENCNKIRVGVVHGHEKVLRFYQKFGFCPRVTVLEMI